jgi:hypothetical protein
MRFGVCVYVVLVITLEASLVWSVPRCVYDRLACVCHAKGDCLLAAIVELVLASVEVLALKSGCGCSRWRSALHALARIIDLASRSMNYIEIVLGW